MRGAPSPKASRSVQVCLQVHYRVSEGNSFMKRLCTSARKLQGKLPYDGSMARRCHNLTFYCSQTQTPLPTQLQLFFIWPSNAALAYLGIWLVERAS